MRLVLLAAPISALLFALSCSSETGLIPEPNDNDVVEPIEGEPVADAGPDQAVAPLTIVFLDGTSSYDPNGLEPLTYQWTLMAKPVGSGAALGDPTSSQPLFEADLAGEYIFELTVQNSAGEWDSSPDEVVVTAAPTDGFYVEVSWDSSSDLDLHLIRSPAALWDYPGDCNFCNTNPDWGVIGDFSDDPSLDADAIYGWGPETITMDEPASGDYRINVHYYGEGGEAECGGGGCQPSPATVKLYLDGALSQTWHRTLYKDGDVWDVATIHWPSGTATFHDQMTFTDGDVYTACDFW